MSREVRIDRLGMKGDGIAETAEGPLFVPFTLPGETVAVEASGKRAVPLEIVETSPERRAPPCPHFGRCGGCDLQHASEAVYRAFKRDLVVEALARENVTADVAPLVPCPPRSRRRVVLTAVRAGSGVSLGYNEAGSNRVVAIETCPIALPAIEAALPALRRLAAILAPRKNPLRLAVTVTASGLDVVAAGAGKLPEGVRQKAVALALSENLARLAADGETLVMPRPPMVDVGGLAAELPAGAFVQAVAASEDAMAALVVAHVEGAKRVADLFSGFGAFALRIAKHAAVHAVEAEAAPLDAMQAASRHASGLKPLTTERRDLFRRPIPAKELGRFDAVVFDPPRAGAEGVARELAGSKVLRIAAVSCNPVTLARDLSILTAGGYRLLSVTPVDQFLWSHHVEAVALLER